MDLIEVRCDDTNYVIVKQHICFIYEHHTTGNAVITLSNDEEFHIDEKLNHFINRLKGLDMLDKYSLDLDSLLNDDN